MRCVLELLERWTLQISVLARSGLRSWCPCLHVGRPGARVQKRRYVLHIPISINLPITNYLLSTLQRLPMASPVPLPVSWPMPAPSRVTHILRIAASTTSAWRVWPVNMVAPLVQFSRSAIVMALATARIPRMFPAGKFHVIRRYEFDYFLRTLY